MKGISKDLSRYEYDKHAIKEKIAYIKGYLQAMRDTFNQYKPKRNDSDEAKEILLKLEKMLIDC